MLATLFPLTSIHFSFSCKKQGQRHKALLFSSFKAHLLRLFQQARSVFSGCNLFHS